MTLSSDGNTLIVGATGFLTIGSTHLFTRSNGFWVHDAAVDTGDLGLGVLDNFGSAVALSPDENTLIIGADHDNDDGAVHIFTKTNNTWTYNQTASDSFPDSMLETLDNFGRSIVFSPDGTTLYIGASGDDTDESTVGAGDDITNAGAVHIFTGSGTSWTYNSSIDGAFADLPLTSNDFLGTSVSLSREGDMLAVGATGDRSSRGAVHLFTGSNTSWTYSATIDADFSGFTLQDDDQFGSAAALSPDENTLAVGAKNNDTDSISGTRNGAVYIFTRDDDEWVYYRKIDGNNSDIAVNDSDQFGSSAVLFVHEERDIFLLSGANLDSTGGDFRGAVYILNTGVDYRIPGLSAEPVYSNGVTLSWIQPNPNDITVSSYEYSQDDGETWAAIPDSDADTTSYTVTDLTPGTTYDFRIRTRNIHEEEIYSDTVSVDVLGLLVNVGYDQVRLAWTTPPGVTGINAFQYRQNDGEWTNIPASNAATIEHSIENLTPGNEYAFTVRAIDRSNEVLATSAAITVIPNKITDGTSSAILNEEDTFGVSTAVSPDGNTLAVGATHYDTAKANTGAVHIFTKNNNVWSHEVTLRDTDFEDLTFRANNYFGSAVLFSSDGNTLYVGSYGDRTGGFRKGAVYIFTKNNNTWSYSTALTDGSNGLTLANRDGFGSALALSPDESMLAVGVSIKDSNNGANANTGAVYLMTRDADDNWVYSTAIENGFDGLVLTDDTHLGSAVTFSSDGDTLIVGASGESTGGSERGAVYFFTKGEDDSWSYDSAATINSDTDDFTLENKSRFGSSTTLSSDGNLLYVGAHGKEEDDNTNRGSVHLFIRNNSAWTHSLAINSLMPSLSYSETDFFGISTALPSDGETLFIGAANDDSDGTNKGAVHILDTDVDIDSTAPTVQTESIETTNTNSDFAKVADTITLTFTVSEVLRTIPTVTIAGGTATVTNTGNTYTATLGVTDATSQGFVMYDIGVLTDLFGNPFDPSEASTDLIVDTTAPTIQIIGPQAGVAQSKTVSAAFTDTNEDISGYRYAQTNTTTCNSTTIADNTQGSAYTQTLTFSSEEDNGSFVCFRAQDQAGNIAYSVTGGIIGIDTTGAVISSQTITTDNTNTDYAKIGDTITLTFTVSEALSETPEVTIDGHSAIITNTGTVYEAAYTVTGTTPEGPVVYDIGTLTDVVGNSNDPPQEATAIAIDRTTPTIAITGPEAGAAQEKTVNAAFTDTNENTNGYRYVQMQTDTCDATVIADNTQGQAYADGQDLTFTSEDDDNNTFICFRAEDLAGNVVFGVSGEIEGIDTTDPVIISHGAISDNTNPNYAKVADTITLTFTVSEALAETPEVLIAGQTATVTNTDNTYEAVYTVTGAAAEGSVTYTIGTLTDAAGNSNDPPQETTTITIDTAAPTIQITGPEAGAARVKTISAAFTDTNVKPDGYRYTQAQTDTCDATVIADNTEEQTYINSQDIMFSSENDNGSFVCFRAEDQAGNVAFGVSGEITGIDVTGAMLLGTPSTDPTEGFVKAGDTITLTFTVSEALSGTPEVTIAGETGTVTNTDNTYTATLEVTGTTPQGFVMYDIGTLTDLLGNSFNPPEANTGIIVDTTTPTIAITGPQAGVAQSKTISAVFTDTNEEINGYRYVQTQTDTCDATVIADNTQGQAYADGQDLVFSSEDDDNNTFICFRAEDLAGNIVFGVSGEVEDIDTTDPVIISHGAISDNTNPNYAKVADTITLTFTVSETLSETPEVTIAGQQAQVTNTDNDYTATYEVEDGDDAQNITYTIGTLTDAAGNSNDPPQETTTITIDTVAPTVQITGPEAGAARVKTISAAFTDTNAKPDGYRYTQAQTDTCDATVIADNTEEQTYINSQDIMFSSEDDNGSFVCFRAEDQAGNISFSVSGEITGIDVTGAVLLGTPSTDPTEGFVKAGDTITLSFTVSEALSGTPEVTIAGETATVTNTDNTYTATLEVTGTTSQGFVMYDIGILTDLLGNSFDPPEANTGIIVDTTTPTVTITGPQAGAAQEKTVTASFTDTNEDTNGYRYTQAQTDTCDATVIADNTEGQAYANGQDLTFASEDDDNGTFICFRAEDLAGNVVFGVSGEIEDIDTTSVTLSSQVITTDNTNPNYAKAEDTLTLTFTTSEQIQTTPTVTIAGEAATVTNTGNDYTATYEVEDGDDAQNITYDIGELTDAAGNSNDPPQETTTITIDTAAPTIQITGPEGGAAQSKTVSAAFTDTNENTNGYRYVQAQTDTCDATVIADGAQGQGYVHSQDIMFSSEDDDNGTFICFRAEDQAGNIAFSVSGEITGIDVTGAVILGTPSTDPTEGFVKVGETMTLTFTVSETLQAAPTVTIAGETATVTNTDNTYTATLAVTGTTSQGFVMYDIGTLTDLLSNSFDPPEANTGIIVDTTTPTIAITGPEAGAAQAKTISAAFTDTNENTNGYRYTQAQTDTCDATVIADNTEGQAYADGQDLTFTSEDDDNNTFICFRAEDLAGNAVFGVSGEIEDIDTTSVVIESHSATTDNTNPNYAKEGDTITLHRLRDTRKLLR